MSLSKSRKYRPITFQFLVFRTTWIDELGCSVGLFNKDVRSAFFSVLAEFGGRGQGSKADLLTEVFFSHLTLACSMLRLQFSKP